MQAYQKTKLNQSPCDVQPSHSQMSLDNGLQDIVIADSMKRALLL